MVYVFPPILFLTITPFLQEGVNLFRSLILFIVCLIYVALHPTILNFKYKIILALMTIPTWYFIGAIVNSLNPILALAGNYNRNFGILTYLSMGLLFLIGANSTLDLERFIRYSVSSLFVLVIVYGYIQVFNLDFLFWAESDRVVLTLGNSNFAASFIAMLITFPIYLYTRAQNFSTKMLYIFITFSAIYLGIKTISFQFRVISIISIIFFILFYKYPLISRYKLWQKVSGLGFLLLSISG